MRRRRVGSASLPAVVFAAAELRKVRDCARCEDISTFQVRNGDFLCELCCLRWIHRSGELPEYNADGSLFRGRLGMPVSNPPARDPIPRVCAVETGNGREEHARYALWLQGIALLNDPAARRRFVYRPNNEILPTFSLFEDC